METINDILREMRECANAADPSIWGDERIAGLVRNTQAEQLKYADRIEAAHERETVTDRNALNNAKLREALEEARKVFKAIGRYWAREMLPIIDAALAEPPRNCDVYTTTDKARWAYHMEGDGLMTMQAFCDWFLAEAEGANDEQ